MERAFKEIQTNRELEKLIIWIPMVMALNGVLLYNFILFFSPPLEGAFFNVFASCTNHPHDAHLEAGFNTTTPERNGQLDK